MEKWIEEKRLKFSRQTGILFRETYTFYFTTPKSVYLTYACMHVEEKEKLIG